VSKRLSAPYRSGPSRDWLKVKNPDSPAMVRASRDNEDEARQALVAITSENGNCRSDRRRNGPAPGRRPLSEGVRPPRVVGAVFWAFCTKPKDDLDRYVFCLPACG
jgi:hypothetical protein